MSPQFSFRPASESQKPLIQSWLKQEHIKKWLHGAGLKNTLEDLDKSFKEKSIFTHWIAYSKETPFAYLLTSEMEEGITLDLFICDLTYLGKGLATPMIQEFLITHFPHASEVLIDPEAANTRAIHVYQKAGFKIVREFIASWNPVPHYEMRLSMKELLYPR